MSIRFAWAVAIVILSPIARAEAPFTLELTVAHQEYDGTFSWFHPRPCSYPTPDGDIGMITLQKWFSSASDFFSGLSVMTTPVGESWPVPVASPALSWREEPNNTTVGICDVTPGWHAATGKVLAVGHTVRYQNAKLMKDPRPRETGYSAYDPKSDSWMDWRAIEMPDPEKYFSTGNGCGQRLTLENGDLLIPMYYKGRGESIYTTIVARCQFDGKTLRYVEHGSEHSVDVVRGLYEPSLTYHDDRYWLTMRNDEKAYVAVSDDGLHFSEAKPWTFDDGKEIGSYNTQAHWISHSDGLYLVYTRRGANNDHIVRNRAPLFMSQVDTKRVQLIRETEVVVVPERGAMLGNFGAAAISPTESWITVGEGMYKDAVKHGANGSVFVAKIHWKKPNKIFNRLR